MARLWQCVWELLSSNTVSVLSWGIYFLYNLSKPCLFDIASPPTSPFYKMNSMDDSGINEAGRDSSPDSDTLEDDLEENQTITVAQQLHTLFLSQCIAFAQLCVEMHACLYSCSVPCPWHNSAFTGHMWVNELLNGHPGWLCQNLSVSKLVFSYLKHALQLMGCVDGCAVKVSEQLAIFLYTCVTGLSFGHVAKRFQRSPATISK